MDFQSLFKQSYSANPAGFAKRLLFPAHILACGVEDLSFADEFYCILPHSTPPFTRSEWLCPTPHKVAFLKENTAGWMIHADTAQFDVLTAVLHDSFIGFFKSSINKETNCKNKQSFTQRSYFKIVQMYSNLKYCIITLQIGHKQLY